MKDKLTYDIMNFIRRDGPENAPICFLTIEDGGSLLENEFDDYINRNDHWIPENERRPLTYDDTGIPGEFIAKIMCGVFGDFDNWREYRANKLYSENEINIKFYPIGRKDTSTWDIWLEKKINMSNAEYITKCLAERYDIINKKLDYIFKDDRIFVILGARDEWSYFLKNYVFNIENIKKDLNSIYVYEFFYDAYNKLLFSYYPMFKYGARSSDALRIFCSELSQKIPKRINQLVKL